MVKTIDPESETAKLLNHYSELDQKIRGKFLTQTIWIEEEIDRIIGGHFGEGKKAKFDLFVGLILNEISFNSKIRIFLTLMKEHHLETFKKFGKIESDLDSIRQFRNILAHAILDLRQSFLDRNVLDEIPLKFYRKGKQETKYLSEKEAGEKSELAGDLLFRLKDLETELDTNQKKS